MDGGIQMSKNKFSFSNEEKEEEQNWIENKSISSENKKKNTKKNLDLESVTVKFEIWISENFVVFCEQNIQFLCRRKIE